MHSYLTFFRRYSPRKFLFNYRNTCLSALKKTSPDNNAFSHHYFLQLTKAYENNSGANDRTKLLDAADSIIKKPVIKITTRELIAPSNDNQDYLSFAPYYWHDDINTSPLHRAKTRAKYKDGRANPVLRQCSDKPKLAQVCARLHLLALAYKTTKDQRYYCYFRSQILAWFINPNTCMNPHLKFGQIRPWTGKQQGHGIIDSRWLVLLIDAVVLINNVKPDKEITQGIAKWLHQFALWLLTSFSGLNEVSRRNNRGSWVDALLVYIALVLNNDEVAKTIIKFSLNQRPQEQIDKEGNQPLELLRYTRVSYSLYNYFPLLYLASVADFYHDNNQLLALGKNNSLKDLAQGIQKLKHHIPKHEQGKIEHIDFQTGLDLNLYYPYSFSQLNHFPCLVPYTAL